MNGKIPLKITKEYGELLPPLPPVEYDNLKESIENNGQYMPIIVNDDDVILDGHHRYRICQELGIEPKVSIKKFKNKEEEAIYVIDSNAARRQMVTLARVDLQLKKKPFLQKIAKKNQADGTDEPTHTRAELAQSAGCSEDTFYKAEAIIQWNDQDLINNVLAGRTTINTAYKKTQVKEPEPIPDLPQGQYSIIYIDPPWPTKNPTAIGSAQQHYPTMSLKDIREMTLPLADNAIVYMWTTSSYLPDAYSIIKSWKLDYRTTYVWNKESLGLGSWNRIQTEYLIMASQGEVTTPTEVASSLYTEKKTKHNAKPDYFYEMIESSYPQFTARLEIFARNKRKNWDSTGNEV